MAVLAAFGVLAYTALPVTVTVVLEDARGGALTSPVNVVARPAGAEADTLPADVSATSRGGVATLELPAGAWTLTPASDAWWGHGLTLYLVEGEPKHVVMRLWPAVTVWGTATVPPNVAVPDRLMLSLRQAPGAAVDAPAVRLSCPLTRGRWSCRIPGGGTFDLDLAHPGFVSHFFWDVGVPAGKDLNLGALVLVAGNEVVGKVATKAGPPSPGTCKVGIRTLEDVPLTEFDARRKLPRAKQPKQPIPDAFSVVANARGFYQITQVPPGAYQVVAEQAGVAEARLAVDVAKAGRTAVDDMVLSSLLTLDLFLDPPVDPAGRPWILDVIRLGGREVMERKVVVPGDGHWTRAGLVADTYLLSVARASGGSWVQTDVQLDAATGPVHLALPVARLRGEVTLGREPVAAKVTLTGPSGSSLEFTADETGTFQGDLPGDVDEWLVRVQAQSPPVTRFFHKVKATPVDGGVEMRLRLPATGLAGVVLGAEGQPAADAVVTVQGLTQVERVVQARTDASGRFAFNGLPPGVAVVTARTGRRVAREVEVQIPEDGETQVTLVVKPLLSVTGRVLSPRGQGIVGAVVSPRPIGSGLEMGLWSADTTDLDGNFTVGLPADTAEAAFRVTARGYALRNFRLPIVPDKPVVMHLEEAGGTLTLELGPWDIASARDFARADPYLIHHGSLEPVRDLALWGLEHPDAGNPASILNGYDRLVLPQMASGEYTLCAITRAQKHTFDRSAAPGAPCTRGTLSHGGELTLSLPQKSER